MKPLITYFSLAFIISWTIWLPLYGPALGLPALPQLPFHHGLGGLGPLLAALITSWLFYKKAGTYQLLKNGIKMQPFLYLGVALFSPFILAIIALLMNYWIDAGSLNFSSLWHFNEFPKFNSLQFFVYNLLFFGFGEEMGWRGFALPEFQKKLTPLKASLVLTIFWAIWHWPLFLYRPGYTTMGIGGIMGWVFSLLTGSMLLTWLYNSARSSILICAVFHATVDMAFTADFADKQVVNYLGFLITIWGVITLFLLKPPRVAVLAKLDE